MKALTITNPWAWAIVDLDVAHLAAGLLPKRIENRDWSWPSMVGKQFAIHTSKGSYDADGARWMQEQGYMTARTLAHAPRYNARGVIIGLARLERVVHEDDDDPLTQNPWFCGEYGLYLRDIIRLKDPIPASGRTMWWDLPPDVAEAVRSAERASVPNF